MAPISRTLSSLDQHPEPPQEIAGAVLSVFIRRPGTTKIVLTVAQAREERQWERYAGASDFRPGDFVRPLVISRCQMQNVAGSSSRKRGSDRQAED
jgi:hypothetical protein